MQADRRTRWQVGVALVALALAVGPAALAKLSGADWKRALATLDAGLKADDAAAIGKGLDAIAPDDSDRAVKLFEKVVKKHGERPEVYGAGLRFVAAQTDKRALKRLRKAATKDKSRALRMVIVEAFAKERLADELAIVEAAVADKDTLVGLKAVRYLAGAKTLDATDALLRGMEVREQKDRFDLVWQSARNRLAGILGGRVDRAIDYRNRLDSRRAAFVEGKGLPLEVGGASEGGKTTTRVTIFGEPVMCERVVLILDRSGSMDQKDPYPKGGVKGRRGGAGTSSREGPADAEKEKPVDWLSDPERERMHRAREELKAALQGLAAEGAAVNVVAYSSGIQFWKPEGTHALDDPKALESALAFCDGLAPQGTTKTDTALRLAFQKCPDADCFYLISDGFVTHDGRTKVPTQDILDEVEMLNQLREVQINTFGFEGSGSAGDGADKELMQGLATLTGGSYTAIP